MSMEVSIDFGTVDIFYVLNIKYRFSNWPSNQDEERTVYIVTLNYFSFASSILTLKADKSRLFRTRNFGNNESNNVATSKSFSDI